MYSMWIETGLDCPGTDTKKVSYKSCSRPLHPRPPQVKKVMKVIDVIKGAGHITNFQNCHTFHKFSRSGVQGPWPLQIHLFEASGQRAVGFRTLVIHAHACDVFIAFEASGPETRSL